jgi:site-specific recombinase XerD
MSYDFYLRSERNCNNNSTVKYLKNFKKIILICIANGWLDKDPFIKYKPKVRPVKRDYLTADELEAIGSQSLANDRISQVRDIFLFSCYTGLAYADVKKLKRSEIVIGNDGQKWIFTSRQKTETDSRIPLLPKALQLMEIYKEHPQCIDNGLLLPVLSNQKMNSYLKEIADACGIIKELTYHIARHTFATTVTLANGVSIESVSKMLGHTNIRTTQHYAKILDLKVGQDMALIKEKYSATN